MHIPIPALIAIALVIAFLLFLLKRRSGRNMLDQQRRDAGFHTPPSPRAPARASTWQSRDSRLTRHDLQHLLEEPDIADAIAKGHKIAAIKLVRARTGLGLKEAKDLVESV